jgi:hypothetical protein
MSSDTELLIKILEQLIIANQLKDLELRTQTMILQESIDRAEVVKP